MTNVNINCTQRDPKQRAAKRVKKRIEKNERREKEVKKKKFKSKIRSAEVPMQVNIDTKQRKGGKKRRS